MLKDANFKKHEDYTLSRKWMLQLIMPTWKATTCLWEKASILKPTDLVNLIQTNNSWEWKNFNWKEDLKCMFSQGMNVHFFLLLKKLIISFILNTRKICVLSVMILGLGCYDLRSNTNITSNTLRKACYVVGIYNKKIFWW